jgi:hypothetical protein
LGDGYGNTLQYEKYWKDVLSESYHCFGGKPFKLVGCCYEVELSLFPPARKECYNKTQYAKRLIGNAFSIPVVEILLRELLKKFPKHTYQKYDYLYEWQEKEVTVKMEDDE